jgi:hypothetical protein
MNLNPVNLAVKAWAKAHDSASQAAINSRAKRIVLVCVNIGSMVMIAITLRQTFEFINAGKVDAVVGTLLGGIFVFFGGVLSVSIPALVTALNATDKNGGNSGPIVPPPTIVTPTNGDNA